MILLGVFKAKLAIAVIAFAGVGGAAVYALRVLIGSMHNRLRTGAESREVALPEVAAIVPIVLVILALAFFPQFGLRRSEASLNATVGPLQAASTSQVAGR